MPTNKPTRRVRAYAVVSKEGKIIEVYASEGCQQCDGGENVFAIAKKRDDLIIFRSECFKQEIVPIEITYQLPNKKK